MIEHIKGKRLGHIDDFLNKVHVELGGKGKHIPPEIRKEIIEEMTSTKKKEGRKFTIEDLIN